MPLGLAGNVEIASSFTDEAPGPEQSGGEGQPGNGVRQSDAKDNWPGGQGRQGTSPVRQTNWGKAPNQERGRRNIMSKIKNWAVSKVVKFQDAREEGQGLAEYGLILALIAVVCIAALTTLGTDLQGILGQVSAGL